MSFKKLLKKTACATLTAALALCSPLMASANPVYDIADDAGFLTDSFSPDDNFTDNEVKPHPTSSMKKAILRFQTDFVLTTESHPRKASKYRPAPQKTDISCTDSHQTT